MRPTAEMRRRSSVATSPGVPSTTSMPSAAAMPPSAAGMGLSKHWARHQDGSEDTDRKTRAFTHDCFLRGLTASYRPAYIDNPLPFRIATRLNRLGALPWVKVC
jgi:hypothetical protein